MNSFVKYQNLRTIFWKFGESLQWEHDHEEPHHQRKMQFQKKA